MTSLQKRFVVAEHGTSWCSDELLGGAAVVVARTAEESALQFEHRVLARLGEHSGGATRIVYITTDNAHATYGALSRIASRLGIDFHVRRQAFA